MITTLLLGLLALAPSTALGQDDPVVFENPGGTLRVALREEVLGYRDPSDPTQSLLISPDGRSVAYVSSGGGSLSVVRNGVEGEGFKGLAKDSLEFSPDSSHLLYFATRDGKSYVVVDDQTFESKLVHDSGARFSPDGQRMAWAAYFTGGAISPVIDGKRGADYEAIGASGVRFSPDSRHYAFIGRREGQEMLVLDGEEGPLLEEILRFWWSPVGGHLAYVARSNGRLAVFLDGEIVADVDAIGKDGFVFPDAADRWALVVRNAESWGVLIDGELEGEYRNLLPGFRFSADGEHYAYLAGKGEGLILVVDGEEEREHPGYDSFQFGTGHQALVVHTGEGKRRVVFDGEAGPSYDAIQAPGVIFDWSGEHWFYIGKNGESLQVVHDGEAGPMAASFGPFAPLFLGDHFLYSIRDEDGVRVVHDGVVGEPFQRVRDLALSEDGSRHAYFGGKRGAWTLVVDGEAQGTFAYAPGAPIFSRDGTRVAHVGARGKRTHVFVDGKPGPAFDFVQDNSLHFTDDARHVVHVGAIADRRYIVVDDVLVDAGFEGFYSPDGTVFGEGNELFVRASRRDVWILARIEILD